METSFGLLFYLKKSNNFREAEVYIYMRITVDGHSAEISTKRKCKPENWDETRFKVWDDTFQSLSSPASYQLSSVSSKSTN